MHQLVALLLISIGAGITHAEYQVTTADGDEIPVRIQAADGETRLVWFPSEFGDTPTRVALAGALAGRDIEVWIPDLHGAWFIPPGRYSLNDIEPAAVAAILSAAVTPGGKPVFLMAEGRTVALVLNGVRHWQDENDATTRLRGLLAFGPRLYRHTPQGGEPAQYLPIAAANNLPIYLLQPRESSGIWRLAEDMSQLQFYGDTPADPAPMDAEPLAAETPTGNTLLRAVAEEKQAPALRLLSLAGPPVDLEKLRGKVVLVNSWAT